MSDIIMARCSVSDMIPRGRSIEIQPLNSLPSGTYHTRLVHHSHVYVYPYLILGEECHPAHAQYSIPNTFSGFKITT